jgi:transmembrane sensor
LDINEIEDLLEKYRQGICTKAEAQLIEEWLATIQNNHQEHFNDDFIETRLIVAKNRIDTLIGAAPVTMRRKSFNWLAGAASFLILGSSIAILVFYFKKPSANNLARQPGVKQYIRNG